MMTKAVDPRRRTKQDAEEAVDLIFYVERGDHVDVWRILHGQRDIPAWMRGSDALSLGTA